MDNGEKKKKKHTILMREKVGKKKSRFHFAAEYNVKKKLNCF